MVKIRPSQLNRSIPIASHYPDKFQAFSFSMDKLPEIVDKLLFECMKQVGHVAEELFATDTLCELEDLKIESPIEMLMYISLKALRTYNYLGDGDVVESRGKHRINGLAIFPQAKIGNYRVDFKLTYQKGETVKEVIVECDSEEFHERSEQERRYEKARDRYLIKKGFTVLHFTGKEIMENPLEVASEILVHLTGLPEDQILIESNFGH